MNFEKVKIMPKRRKTMNLGFVKIATFTPNIKVADVEYNSKSIISGIELADLNS